MSARGPFEGDYFDRVANDFQAITILRGEGPLAEQIRAMFMIYTRKFGKNQEGLELSVDHFVRSREQIKQI
jgi:hypothetical protein